MGAACTGISRLVGTGAGGSDSDVSFTAII